MRHLNTFRKWIVNYGSGSGVAIPCACILSGNKAIWLSTILMVGVSLCFTIGAAMIFLWARRTGQFNDVEGVKYRMLMDDEQFLREIENGKLSPPRVGEG